MTCDATACEVTTLPRLRNAYIIIIIIIVIIIIIIIIIQLESCIVFNEHNTVIGRIGPLYATGVFWAHQSPESKQYLGRIRNLQGLLGDRPTGRYVSGAV